MSSIRIVSSGSIEGRPANAPRPHFIAHGFRRGQLNVRHYDVGARVSQRQRDPSADPAASTGHHCRFSVQIFLERPLSLSLEMLAGNFNAGCRGQSCRRYLLAARSEYELWTV